MKKYTKKEQVLSHIDRIIAAWIKSGGGYIDSHGFYVHEELASLRKKIEKIL